MNKQLTDEMPSGVLMWYKKLGETPLQALDRLRLEKPEYKDAVLSYAGRLDPMAEGLLIVLVGEENKKREQYLGLDKVYEAEILFGIDTDTHDVLGLVKSISEPHNFDELETKIREVINNFPKQITLKYPHYSSKTVNGKALHEYARAGALENSGIEIPERVMNIHEMVIQDIYFITAEEMLGSCREKISHVQGDFRQEKIVEQWREVLNNRLERMFMVAQVNIACSSGTYIRSIAHELGKRLTTGACLYSLKRTQVGGFKVEQ